MNKTIYVVSTRYIEEGRIFNDQCKVEGADYYKLCEASDNEEVVIYGNRCPDGNIHNLQDRLNDYCQHISENIDDDVHLIFLLHDKDISTEDHANFRLKDNRRLKIGKYDRLACEMRIYGYTHTSQSFFGKFLKSCNCAMKPLDFHHRLSAILDLFEAYEGIWGCNEINSLEELAQRDFIDKTIFQSTAGFDMKRKAIIRQFRNELYRLSTHP